MRAAERERNEEMAWGVNLELGIAEPVVEEEQQVPRGGSSAENAFWPFRDEVEMLAGLEVVEAVGGMSEAVWGLWLGMMDAVCVSDEEDAREEVRVLEGEEVEDGRDPLRERSRNVPPAPRLKSVDGDRPCDEEVHQTESHPKGFNGISPLTGKKYSWLIDTPRSKSKKPSKEDKSVPPASKDESS